MIYWLKHHHSWFGFTEPAEFMKHEDGGFFVKKGTTEQIFSSYRNGKTAPNETIN